jgi:NACHT domain- and WD repeat-containing protein
MPLAARTFRVFVSSTFSDLVAERNALQEHVFPRLRELCREHGTRFQAIDLRWGVSEEAGLDQQAMKICLAEIARCQKVSPRPNFIILLGDRFGWRPLPYAIPVKEVERLLPLVSVEERERLLWRADQPAEQRGWYRRDDNAVPAEYVLQPRRRGSRYEDHDVWEREVEKPLGAALERAALRAGLNEDALIKYTHSATGQEIAVGALKVPNAQGHVFGFFREIEDLPRWSDSFGEAEAEAVQKQRELKERLKQQIPGNIREYTARWQGDGPSLGHLDRLCEDVYATLSQVILTEIGQLATVAPLDREISAHDAFCEDRARGFIGRTDLLKAIADHVTGSDTHPLAVWGPSGSGKSALLAEAIRQAQRAGYEPIHRFLGATPDSSNVRALLESLCHQISRRYGEDEASIPSEYRELVQEFPKRLALARPENPIILFLDALDQITDAGNACGLVWLPTVLPQNAHLIISTLPGECLRVLAGKLPESNRLEVRPMATGEGQTLLGRWLAEAGRRLQPEQERQILSKFDLGGLPLYLKLAFEEARWWESYAEPPELSADIPGILSDLFGRLSQDANHGPQLVARSLGYLAAAKSGLSEDELLDVLGRDEAVRADFQRRSPKSPDVEGLPVVVWSRLYFDLEPYLSERSADGTSLLVFYHRQLSEAARAEYLAGQDKSERHLSLADYFDKQPVYRAGGGLEQPNLRKLSEQPYQQAWAGEGEALVETLTNFVFVQAKVSGLGVRPLIEDYDLATSCAAEISAEQAKSLKLIRGALQLSAHILARDKNQVAGQLLGRLMAQERPEIQALIEQARRWKGAPWLRPLTPCLMTPGGSLLYTFACSESEMFDAVVIAAPNGQFVVSHGLGGIEVWDLESGTKLHSLAGHSPFDQISRGSHTFLMMPDGRRVIIQSKHKYKTLSLCDLEDGRTIRTFPNHGALKAVSPDGHHVISGAHNNWREEDGDFALEVLELETGLEQATLVGHTGHVNAVAITPDGRWAVSGSDDGTLKVWSLENGTCLRTLKGHTNGVGAIALTPDGQRAVSGTIGPLQSKDYALRVWDLQSGACLHTLAGHTDYVSDVTITPSGRLAVSLSESHCLKVWDLEQGLELHTPMSDAKVYRMVVAPDGRRIISTDYSNLKVWDLESGVELRTLTDAAGEINAIAVTLDGRRAITGGGHLEGAIKVWDLEPESEVHAATSEKPITSVAVTPDCRRAICSSKDQSLTVWDLERDAKRHTFLHAGSLLAVTPDSRHALSRSEEGTLKVWDLTAGTQLHPLSTPMSRVMGVLPQGSVLAIPMPDGRRVLYQDDQTIKVWDLISGRELRTISSAGDLKALAPDGRVAISQSSATTLRVWDLEGGAELGAQDTFPFWTATVTPDGWRAIIVSKDNRLRVIDLRTGMQLRAMQQTVLGDPLVIPDGRRVICDMYTPFGLDRITAFGVWDLESGSQLYRLEGHFLGVTSDGRYAISIQFTEAEPTLKAWDLENGQAIASFNLEPHALEHALALNGAGIVAGNSILGRVHVIRLENFVLGPPIVSAWLAPKPPGLQSLLKRKKEAMAFGCPHCNTWSEVPDEALGTELPCPHCGIRVKLNPFVIEADWRPTAAAR